VKHPRGIEEHDLKQRASWIAWRYGLDEESILAALKRADVRVTHSILIDYFYYLAFSPSLTRALVLTRPQAVVEMYKTADLEDLRSWEKLTERLIGDKARDWPDIEELCRWDAEQYLLPD
jgi:hypothetical protein